MKPRFEIFHVDSLWISEAWDGSAYPSLLDDRPVSSHRTLDAAKRRAEGKFPRIWTGKYAILERTEKGLRVPKEPGWGW